MERTFSDYIDDISRTLTEEVVDVALITTHISTLLDLNNETIVRAEIAEKEVLRLNEMNNKLQNSNNILITEKTERALDRTSDDYIEEIELTDEEIKEIALDELEEIDW